MKTQDLPFFPAADMVSKSRSVICPNLGFINQLQLWEKMGKQLEGNSAPFVRYRSIRMKSLLMHDLVTFHEQPALLGTAAHPYAAERAPPPIPTVTSNHLIVCNACKFSLQSTAFIFPHTAPSPQHKCSVHFVLPGVWFGPTPLLNRAAKGELFCPKCPPSRRARIGGWSWDTPTPCQCGFYLKPCFWLKSEAVTLCAPDALPTPAALTPLSATLNASVQKMIIKAAENNNNNIHNNNKNAKNSATPQQNKQILPTTSSENSSVNKTNKNQQSNQTEPINKTGTSSSKIPVPKVSSLKAAKSPAAKTSKISPRNNTDNTKNQTVPTKKSTSIKTTSTTRPRATTATSNTSTVSTNKKTATTTTSKKSTSPPATLIKATTPVITDIPSKNSTSDTTFADTRALEPNTAKPAPLTTAVPIKTGVAKKSPQRKTPSRTTKATTPTPNNSSNDISPLADPSASTKSTTKRVATPGTLVKTRTPLTKTTTPKRSTTTTPAEKKITPGKSAKVTAAPVSPRKNTTTGNNNSNSTIASATAKTSPRKISPPSTVVSAASGKKTVTKKSPPTTIIAHKTDPQTSTASQKNSTAISTTNARTPSPDKSALSIAVDAKANSSTSASSSTRIIRRPTGASRSARPATKQALKNAKAMHEAATTGRENNNNKNSPPATKMGHASLIATQAKDSLLQSTHKQPSQVTMGNTNQSVLAALLEADSGGKPLGKAEHPVQLICVQGRRNLKCILVDPHAASIDHGASYVLDDFDHVYVWHGTYANRMERAKAVDVATRINTKERQCRGRVIPINPDSGAGTQAVNHQAVARFWELLGSQGPPPTPPKPGDKYMKEDEEADNRDAAYQFVQFQKENRQVLATDKMERSQLDSNDCYVVDGGNDIYVWIGKKSSQSQRQSAQQQAQEWLQSFHKSPTKKVNSNNNNNNNNSKHPLPYRTKCARIFKLFENAEKILFQEKFWGWGTLPMNLAPPPITPRLKPQLEAFALDTMFTRTPITSTHQRVGEQRGKITHSWMMKEFEKYAVQPTDYGHFYSSESYIITYAYFNPKGREEFVIYFWQGRYCSINDKGTAAYLTVEVDTAMFSGTAPQIRVLQDREPKHFMDIFGGRIVVHRGRAPTSLKTGAVLSPSKKPGSHARLYQIQVNAAGCRATQMETAARALNSNFCYLLFPALSAAAMQTTALTPYLWRGKGATSVEWEWALKVGKEIIIMAILAWNQGQGNTRNINIHIDIYIYIYLKNKNWQI
jgi:hypothetical protein